MPQIQPPRKNRKLTAIRLAMNLFLPALLIYSALIAHSADRIYVDGHFPDWSAVPVTHMDPSGDQTSGNLDFTELKITNDDRFLFISIDVTDEINIQNDNDLVLYIDTDDNPATGQSVNGIGAELVWWFGDRYGYFYSNGGTYSIDHPDIGLVTAPSVTSVRFEIAIDRTLSVSGHDLFESLSGKYVLKDTGPGQDMIPDAGEFAGYGMDETPLPELPIITLDRGENAHIRVMTYNVLGDGFFESGLYDSYNRILTAVDPDIIGFQEIYDHSAPQTAARVESMLPSGPQEQWYYSGTYPDVILVSRYPVLYTAPVDGNAAFLLDTMGVCGTELLVVVAHLPAGDNDYDRQLEVDRIMAMIRDAMDTGGSMGLQPDTPYIIMGDMNFVGYATQLETMLTGNIVNAAYGPSFNPDWDGSALTDSLPRLTEWPLCYTWYKSWSSYSPGRMDFIIYSDSVMQAVKRFVLTTYEMSPDQLNQWGLHANDTSAASDHQPLVADFYIPDGEPTPTPGTPTPSTPTPAVTATPPAPTATPAQPTPTPSPTASEVSVQLVLSKPVFTRGDLFNLDAVITNPGPEQLADQPFVALLDVYSSYFWYPDWTGDFTFERITVDTGSTTMQILHFIWPETTGSGSGIMLYGALLNQELTGIVGLWDSVTFGWY